MYKGIITTSTIVSANTNIPFNTVWNTNGNTSYNATNNTVSFLTPGYYDISGLVVATNVSGDITLGVYADGVEKPESKSSGTTEAVTDLITLPISETVYVRPSDISSLANISVQLSTGATIVNGLLTVERRK